MCDRRAPAALVRLSRLAPQVQGRGACAHPDGTVRFVGSALTVFAAELQAHLGGRCTAASSEPVLPVPTEPVGWR